MNFLGLEGAAASYDTAQAVVISVPYDRTCSYVKGAASGPEAILTASPNAEWYDEELDLDLENVGIATLPPLDVEALSPDDMVERVRERSAAVLAENKIPATLGGEHTISLGCVKAALEHHPGLTVLQVDAHPDLRDTYEGLPVCHATVGRRIAELAPLVQVGVRAWSREEQEFMTASSGHSHPLVTIPARFVHQSDDWIEQAAAALGEKTYITFDVDAFDPSLMPATGTPEPGGLTWRHAADLLSRVASCTTIVGFDVVELSPVKCLHHCDYTAARLAARLIGLAVSR